jgi:hypothetical protein
MELWQEYHTRMYGFTTYNFLPTVSAPSSYHNDRRAR